MVTIFRVILDLMLSCIHRCGLTHRVGALGIGGRVWRKFGASGAWGGRVFVALFCAWGVLRGNLVPPRATVP